MEKLNHLPYEDWLLDEATLNAGEKQQLRQHLQECAACQQLSVSLNGMEMELRAAPLVAPAAGFAGRWQARLQAQQVVRRRRQTLFTMIFVVGGAMALFVMLLAVGLPLLGMSRSVVILSIYELVRAFSVASTLGQAVTTIFRVGFNLVPPTMWVAILVAMGGLGAVWIVALQQLTTARRVVL
jgi:hypothetical protein